jgi:hypothetical protein
MVRWKLTVDRRRTESWAGTTSATAVRGDDPPSPLAASAAAGKAMQRIRTGRKYVRFVSKRRTVPVFAAAEGDRAHTAHIVRVI